MHHMHINGRPTPLFADRPEDLVRAFAINNVANQGREDPIAYPSQQLVNWLKVSTPAYDQSCSYWFPYGYLGTPGHDPEMYVHSWARGGLGYLASLRGFGYLPDLRQIDPTVWYSGITKRAEELGADGPVLAAFELAEEQNSPGDLWGDLVIEQWTHVRNAIQRGRLIIDPLRIARKRRQLQLGEQK